MKENSIERDIHLLESYAGMTHKMTDNQGRPKLDQAIEHILSEYKRVLKENEELKRKNKTLEELLQGNLYELYKYYKELADTYQGNCIPVQKVREMRDELDRTKAEYMEWQKQELDQKDKIIDLMAETINNHDIDEDICKQMGQKANCNEFEDTEKCKECIKQYFENKAKEIR